MNDITHPFVPLRDEEIAGAQAAAHEATPVEWSAICPIPDTAPPVEVSLWGNQPSATWIYRDAEGRALGVECRWLVNGDKEIRFATWCRNADGRESWRLKHLPPPRPIFGLDRLAAKPDAPVLIVEGPKKCAPAEHIFPDYVAIAWPAGANSTHLVDWSTLRDRVVVIWPDNDDPGREAASKIIEHVLDAGAFSVRTVPVPRDFPPSWDLAEEPPPDVDLIHLLAAAHPAALDSSSTSSAAVLADSDPAFVSWNQFAMSSSGLTISVTKGRGEDKKEIEEQVAGPFEVLGRARDPSGRGWGRWLRWLDADGRTHTRHVTDAALQGDPASLCAMLADEGLHIVRGRQRALCDYLNGCEVDERVTIVNRTGWHKVRGGQVFVLPNEIIGVPNVERVILEASANGPYEARGTLAGWQEGIAEAVGGHFIPLLGVATAFAGPLLAFADQEGGGINLFGTSSRGKTTVAQAAASVWGRGSSSGFVRTWRATANGLEGVAASATDTVLILDELGIVDARDAAAAIYGLANGTGKARAARDGSLRDPKSWRTLILSTGELPIEGKLAEDKGRRAKAGQLVRMLDISADRRLGFGVFDHGGSDGDASKIADSIKRAAVSHYGVVGPEFLRRLLKEDLQVLARHLRVATDEFVANNIPQGSDGQVIRAAQRLGLIGAAGEIARAYGIVPWTEGAAFAAAAWALERWIENRGGTDAAEARHAVEQVRRFFEAHGESRFEPIDDVNHSIVHNRAGWRSGHGEDREWFVPPETWKFEICAGMDATAVARYLVGTGMMRRVGGSFQSVRRIGGATRRVYVLTNSILAGDSND